jgi:two-component system sensor histidine kinase KdpD
VARGQLRVYLGAAPGVGKTFAMLNEGRRRRDRGTDVVVGYVETHGRPRTAEQVGDLEVVPRRRIDYRGTTFEEMDVDAVLARRPKVALVDELAHTNVPGSRNAKRWQDVRELLDAGIDVVSTVNIQHLESINDVVERITGVKQRETIPDDVVREAEQVELVDQTPQALRRRMAHGNIYAPEKIDAALANYFREGNLGALRELALLWVADKVDVGLEEYRERHRITEPWETRERVVVALTGAPSGDALIRRAARIAQRAHGELVGVHIRSEEGLAGPAAGLIERHRALLAELGGEYHEIGGGGDVAATLVDFARSENATQLVLGASQRSRWVEITRGSVINRVIRLSGPIDVHVISHSADEPRGPGERRQAVRRHVRSPVPTRRIAVGFAIGAAGVPALTAILAHLRESISLSTVLLVLLTLVVTTAAVGGTVPALATALGAFLAANWYFTPPYFTWTISEGENVVALAVFLGVAGVVSRFVDIAATRRTEADRARREATILAAFAATMSEADPLPALVAHIRSTFALDAAALLRHEDGRWHVEATSGEPPLTSPEDADLVEPLAADTVLALAGPAIAAADRAVLNAFAAQLRVMLEHGRLRLEAGRAQDLAEANALRTALLQAVSHDLRTPLASIKASVTSLLQHDVEWTPEDAQEFLETIDEETDRLTALVGNLLDMSRIQTGVLRPDLVPVALEEVVPSAIVSLGPRGLGIDFAPAETLPPVLADPALLERALANVLDNATRLSPPERRVRVEAGAFDGRIDLRVVDRGPGIPRELRDQVFQPFQRLGDHQPATGVGLGLAVARGFLSAMGASIEIDDTPGGGTTVVITLPVAAP